MGHAALIKHEELRSVPKLRLSSVDQSADHRLCVVYFSRSDPTHVFGQCGLAVSWPCHHRTRSVSSQASSHVKHGKSATIQAQAEGGPRALLKVLGEATAVQQSIPC